MATTVAGLSMAIATPAHAAPNTAKAWGANNKGQLGIGSTEGPEKCSGSSVSEAQTACSTSPIAVSGVSGVTAIAGGGGSSAASGHSLALLEDGSVVAWGEGSEGQLGDGKSGFGDLSDVPVAVCAVREAAPCAKHLEGVTAIAASGAHSMALLSSGVVVEWGELSTGGSSGGPVEVSGLSGVTAIAAGSRFSFAVVAGGEVMAWGTGSQGQLGNGSTTGGGSPAPVCAAGPQSPCPSGPYLEGASAVSASARHSLALLSSGAVMAWGANSEGELGNGTETGSDVPVEVSGLSGVTAISAGGRGGNGGQPFSLALLGNGTVKAWGANEEGELGDGTFTGPETCGGLTGCAKVPVTVSELSGVSAIAAHGKHSVALLANGAIKAWGGNEFGTLGIGTSTGPESCFFGSSEGGCSTKPVAVSNVVGAKGIGAGDANAFAFGPPPTVTRITPKAGPASGGTYTGILGTGFSGATAVKFGSQNAASFIVRSSTLINAETPAGMTAGNVDVTVTNGWGTSATSTADRFKVRPTVTGVSPNSGPTAGGTSVTVKGSGFTTGTIGTRFKFGTKRGRSVSCSSSTECTVLSPAHEAGTVDVRATVNKVVSAKNPPADQFSYS